MVRDLYSWKRRLEATVFIFGVGFGFFLFFGGGSDSGWDGGVVVVKVVNCQ